MQFRRGGGYWLWKPWIIQKTIQEHAPGDIVVYADAGGLRTVSSRFLRLGIPMPGFKPWREHAMVNQDAFATFTGDESFEKAKKIIGLH